MSELKRSLNLTEVIFFAAGVILGAGIYTVIGKAAGVAGTMLWLSFAIAAVTATLSLFAYAELIALYPSSGGEFAFVKEAAGIRWAYPMGFIVALSGILSAATISLGFAGYLEQLIHLPRLLSTLAIIGLLFLVNVLGIKHSSVVNIIFTLVEAGGLVFVIVTAAPAVGDVNYTELPGSGLTGILTGAAVCFFAFTGFEDAVKLAEETKNPEKNIPRGLFIASGLVSCFYLAMAVVVISMIPFGELGASDSPLSLVVEKRFGHTGAVVIAVVALFSTSNSLLSNMLGSSRVLLNIGKENRRLRLLSRVLPGRKTPITGLVVAAGLAFLFSLIGEIRYTALLTNFMMFVTFLAINITVIYLRVTKKDLERPFKIPGSIRGIPVLSLLAIGMILTLIGFTVYGLATGSGEGGH